MPLIRRSSYIPPAFMKNGHVQTVFASTCRKVSGVVYERERIDTPDDDFLDLDWSRVGSRKVAVLCHGLEGDSLRPYMLGMARALNRRGWDVAAWSYRGCSGEPNRCLRFYHSGETGDLETVIRRVLGSNRPLTNWGRPQEKVPGPKTRAGESLFHTVDSIGTEPLAAPSESYRAAALIGFSLGGNIILKYLGERGEGLDPRIGGAVAFSVPCDLASGARRIARSVNRIYLGRFLKMLREKIRAKMELMPGAISDEGFEDVKSFKEFDDRYTAPLHGFESAEDYWERASCKPYLHRIQVPALLVNAFDDPLLPRPCYPLEEALDSPCLSLEIPWAGGHVGFVSLESGEYWSESRAASFLDNELGISAEP